MTGGLTPSQTVGPFLGMGLPWPDGPFVVAEGTPGAITISGTLSAVLHLINSAQPVADLPFKPGSSGYSSVFVGFYPVFLVIQLAAMLWLEMLLARSRYIPALSFVEQPPTYTETYLVQRFQASLSAFSTIWNFLALMALLFWLLFYAL